MRLERIVPGRRSPSSLVGSILTRDITVAGERWSKGRRLSAEDLVALGGLGDSPDPAGPADGPAAGLPRVPLTVLVPEPGDVHEDEAGLRLAEATRGGDETLALRGPNQSRVDLVATVDGVVAVRIAALERVNRIDPLEVFTAFDGQVVARGDLVASVKIGPHLVTEAVLSAGERAARRGGPLVRVRPFRPVRIAVLVKESISGAARERFERSVRAKVAGLGATMVAIRYVPNEALAVTEALAAVLGAEPRPGIVLTAGGASTDPGDPFFVALDALGGRVVRHGVPAHPGSMLWLGRRGRTAIVGLPSCGAFSMATAADLLLSRLVAGEPPTAATVARLGHGGILTRDQRFRFPSYARDLDAPDG